MRALAEAIAAQAELLAAVMTVELDEAVSQLESARRVWLVGTGTSQHAAELGAGMFAGGDKEVHARSSAAFAYTDGLRGEDAVVVISHTTETAFAQRARERVLESPARLVTITGQGKDWPEAVQTVEAERSETYTVSYLAALMILARVVSEHHRGDHSSVREESGRAQIASSRPLLRTFDAPVIIVSCANKNEYLDRYARPEKGHADRSDAWWPAPYWDIDTGFAALLILLTAVDLGLGACIFGLPVDRIDAFREAFGVPSDFRPIGAISIGYPAEAPEGISAHRRPEEEVAHRRRWSASDQV